MVSLKKSQEILYTICNKKKNMTVGICKFCGEKTTLCGSHIIPKAFYQLNKFGRQVGVCPATNHVDKTRYQNGIKEPLLCAKCDRELGKLDDYAQNILLRRIQEHHFKDIDELKIYLLQADDFDYAKLRLFFISLAWRASISSARFSLGKYENVALHILKKETSDDPNLFIPIVLRKNTRTPADNINTCFASRCCGKKACVVRFPDYEITIITTQKDNSDTQAMDIFKSLLTQQEFLVIETNFITSYDAKLISVTLQTLQQRR